MAQTGKNGFRTVEKQSEEKEMQVRNEKRKMIRHAIEVAVLLVIVIVAVELLYELRSFNSYEIRNSVSRSDSNAAEFEEYNEYILEYSKDGIACVTYGREQIWKQAYEMTNPKVEVQGDYVAVYDGGGKDIYILGKNGLEKHIRTTVPIQTLCLAKQGTVAVLMKQETESQVKLYDKKGNELANGKFYGEKGSFPVDIALSYDGTKLAVDMIDISQGTINTTISFYNFGTVGQNSIDNNVGTYTYEGEFIPEIDYISDTGMLAFGTERIILFSGKQKPVVEREIIPEQTLQSVFHNEKYIGLVYDNLDSDDMWHVKVLDLKGNTVMENEISIAYKEIEFLSNNEICVKNDVECEIFTLRSIKRFSYTFDKGLYKIIAGENGQNYIFIFEETTEEVRLK